MARLLQLGRGVGFLAGLMTLSLVVGSCSGSAESLVLPTPGPDSLILEEGDATFRLVGTVLSVRGAETVGPDGYPDDIGAFTMEDAQVFSSVRCLPDDRTTLLHFGPAWDGDGEFPRRDGTPWLPTRFAIGEGALLDLQGERIQAWGSFRAAVEADCSTLVLQYVETIRT